MRVSDARFLETGLRPSMKSYLYSVRKLKSSNNHPMKNSTICLALICRACDKPIDENIEKAAITKLIDDETKYAVSADAANWATCWVNSADAMLVEASADRVELYQGTDSLTSVIGKLEPFELNLKRNNYIFTIGRDLAFVTFDQYDDMRGLDRRTKESRTLQKIDGHWKILNANVVDVSSYERQITASFHSPLDQLPADPRTSFHNQHGLGGMAVGYVEVPAGADFTPLFEGLPQNMCPSPHWGYVVEGSMTVKYADGKEEALNAGEVFYMPAPHTGKSDAGAKFIDFSPEAEFTQVMDHIAGRMAEQKAK